ncbi:MAG: aminoglycoside phosphotransferase family protein [Acidobacteriia bacterium]|nr:aminoglycoside phosphotransferase family protein [Terriglobia bacterium]
MAADDAGRRTLDAFSSRLLRHPVTSIVRLGGGGNSRTYDVRAGARRIAVKQYVARADGRRPMAAEFEGLSFLWRAGVRAIPRPLAADATAGCAAYAFVEGAPVARVGAADVDRAVRFLSQLRRLAAAPGSRRLPAASEACFSMQDILDSLDRRVRRLRAARRSHSGLRRFLDRDFAAARADIGAWARARLDGSALDLRRPLARGLRTLSPSDFGFHNARRRPDGSLVFLDFEYFGWDDPAKMVADFLLHPAMTLPEPLRRRFVDGVVRSFRGDPALRRRVEVVWGLYGLKWCLILLNEFVPRDLSRRRFAAARPARADVARRRQLRKAERLLATVTQHYARFPYGE